MESYQANQLLSLRAVDDFLTQNSRRLYSVVNTGARRQLAEILAEVDADAVAQAASTLASQGATRRNQMLRRVLVRDHMAPIARMARAQLPPVPEGDALRAPRPNWSIDRLYTAAQGMAVATAQHRAAFVEAGLAWDFVEALTAAAEAMIGSVSDRAMARGRVSGATKGLRTSLAAGRQLVVVLDALIARSAPDDPALLASWKSVKRVRRIGPRPREDGGTAFHGQIDGSSRATT